MRITGKLTELELKEAAKLSRSNWYWPKLLLRSWYGLALTGLVLWATVAGLLGTAKANWKGLGAAWTVIILILVVVVFRARRATGNHLEQLNASFADSITITGDGLHFDGPNGASAFQPWKNFKVWYEGKRVILLYRSEGPGFFILPVAYLSDIERQSLLNLFRASIDAKHP